MTIKYYFIVFFNHNLEEKYKGDDMLVSTVTSIPGEGC